MSTTTIDRLAGIAGDLEALRKIEQGILDDQEARVDDYWIDDEEHSVPRSHDGCTG